MQQGNYQIQKQQQVQTLSPQQVLVVKMLELPAVELEERVRAEVLTPHWKKDSLTTSATKTI